MYKYLGPICINDGIFEGNFSNVTKLRCSLTKELNHLIISPQKEELEQIKFAYQTTVFRK